MTLYTMEQDVELNLRFGLQPVSSLTGLGLGIMLTKQLQLPVIPRSFRKHEQRNSIKES